MRQRSAPAGHSGTCGPFVHANLWHLLGNMVFLWLAGAVIECFWDRGPFVGLYFVAGAAAVLAQHLADPDSMVPLVGASGAIAGRLGASLIGMHRLGGVIEVAGAR